MEYPILIEGRPCGTLTESAEGLYTVFRADCPPRSGLIRLWLHGGGQSTYLGLLTPKGGRLVLTRRLSRTARAAFPRRIEHASDRPGVSAGKPAPRRDAGEAVGESPPPPSAAPEPSDADGTLWRALPDGSLISSDGRRAIPAALPPSSPLAAHLLRIRGRDYLVFRL